jgi:hypothetical protein
LAVEKARNGPPEQVRGRRKKGWAWPIQTTPCPRAKAPAPSAPGL